VREDLLGARLQDLAQDLAREQARGPAPDARHLDCHRALVVVHEVDIFCRAGDFPRILGCFQAPEYRIEIEDERWIAKVFKDPYFFDVIFNSISSVTPINDHWFAEGHMAHVYGSDVQIIAPTELVWSKAFVQNRYRYDGADIAHVILKQHENIDWKRLLCYMDQYWEVLLFHIINFRFVYPTMRDCIPRWLFDELVERLKLHADLPVAQTRICRGRLYSPRDYQIDIEEWGFADVVGMGVGKR
jgi:hypothetical protein